MLAGLELLLDDEKEDITQVLAELNNNCSECRLAQGHPSNRGMVIRGNPNAKIAVVGTAPSDGETQKGVPFTGLVGKELEKWLSFMGLDARTDTLMTNIIQCQPPKKEINGRMKTRDPEKDEISACFGPRCLRVMRAMPNLEAIIILGWVAAKAFLGTSGDENVPKQKTHEGGWFESSLLPGVAIFCLTHPADVVYLDSPEKKMVIQKFLGYFKREYLTNNKISGLAQVARERREELGLGLF